MNILLVIHFYLRLCPDQKRKHKRTRIYIHNDPQEVSKEKESDLDFVYFVVTVDIFLELKEVDLDLMYSVVTVDIFRFSR